MRIVGLFVVLFGLISCSRDVQSVATPKPTKANARISGKPLATLKRGHGVYMRHCAQCHEHRLPNTVSLPAWHAKIDSMSDLAGLSKEDHDSLQLYLGEFSDR